MSDNDNNYTMGRHFHCLYNVKQLTSKKLHTSKNKIKNKTLFSVL